MPTANRTPTEEEIIEAAGAAHAHSFIRRLPNGYDTVITENGGNISQGQKQLLCIARVLLCLPPMLILDEATSSIDTSDGDPHPGSLCPDDGRTDKLYCGTTAFPPSARRIRSSS